MKSNPEDRWREHIQVINRNGGCPALKDAIKKYGVDSFKFEVLIICFDEDRFKYEKEYIKKYNSQVPNGYNILPGGEGGGFLGKKHTHESIKKIVESCKKFREKNPNHFETYREKLKESMKWVDISSAVKKSEKFRKAVSEGRVGGGSASEEAKQKISQSLLKYYKQNGNTNNKINIEKHRETMTNVLGRKVRQYNKDGELVREYMSISDAGRNSGVKKSNIQRVLGDSKKSAGGYIWRYADEKGLKEQEDV